MDEPEVKRSVWERVAPWIVGAGAIAVLLLTIDNHVLAQDAKNLSQQNLNSQNHHHAATVKKDAQLQAALNDVQQSAAAIKYLGGVIVYQNGQIIAGQQQGHATLNVLTALQQELTGAETSVGGALVKGQAQINAYFGYLTCLVTNTSDQAACGAAPPLPATMG